MKKKNVLIMLLLCCGAQAVAGEWFYPSGQLRLLQAGGSPDRPKLDLESFHRRYFSNFPDFEWRLKRTLSDATHQHHRYSLYYRGRRVVFQNLNVHVRHSGEVDFSTNTLQRPFELSPLRKSETELTPREIETRLSAVWKRNGRQRLLKFRMEPVIYAANGKNARYAYEVFAGSRRPFFQKHVIIDSLTGELLSSRKVLRHVNHQIYRIHPDAEALSDESLPGVTSLLTDGQFVVQREAFPTGANDNINIDATHDFTGDGVNFAAVTHTSADYNTNCANTTTTGCPNQSLDAINVFFHLRTYRTNLDSYLSGLGASVNFDLDPLEVTVNTNSIDLNDDGNGAEFNNAFYASNIEDLESNLRSGLFFLPPANISGMSSLCPGAVLKDLAREALVIVHEYQHYITDKITDLIPSPDAPDTYFVGDALHEGYSDYFAASEISALAGTDVTEVGEFAFANCSDLRRDVGSLKVFSDSNGGSIPTDFSDAHTAGWTWASGLWQLREELGREVADKIAYKSMFFLSTLPGFVESVEAVVQADEALYNGANRRRIRELFYGELNFKGGIPGDIFSDDYTLALGFQSCLSVHPATAGGPTGALFLLWLAVTWALGRRARAPREKKAGRSA